MYVYFKKFKYLLTKYLLENRKVVMSKICRTTCRIIYRS